MLTTSFGHISQIGGDVGGLEEDVSVDDALIRLKLTNPGGRGSRSALDYLGRQELPSPQGGRCLPGCGPAQKCCLSKNPAKAVGAGSALADCPATFGHVPHPPPPEEVGSGCLGVGTRLGWGWYPP